MHGGESVTLKRNIKSKRAKAVFYTDVNDVDVYVEDTEKGTEKLYEIFLYKALSPTITIKKVFPLGGKIAVARAWESRDKKLKRKQVFIIDSDFALLEFEAKKYPYNIQGKGFLLLPRFCFENYLLSEEAALSLMDEEDVQKNKAILKKNFNYKDWYKKNKLPLLRLFVYLFTARKVSEKIPVKKYNYRNVITDSSGIVDKVKCNDLCNKIEQEALKYCRTTHWKKSLTDTRREMKNEYSNEILYLVCGKQFLWNLFYLRMISNVTLHGKKPLIKQKITRKLPVEHLKELSECITTHLT